MVCVFLEFRPIDMKTAVKHTPETASTVLTVHYIISFVCDTFICYISYQVLQPFSYNYARNDRPSLCSTHSVIFVQDWSRTNKEQQPNIGRSGDCAGRLWLAERRSGVVA